MAQNKCIITLHYSYINTIATISLIGCCVTDFQRPRHVGFYLQFLYRTCVNTHKHCQTSIVQSSLFTLTLLTFDLIKIDNSINSETTFKTDHVLKPKTRIRSRSFTRSFRHCHPDLTPCEWNLGLLGD